MLAVFEPNMFQVGGGFVLALAVGVLTGIFGVGGGFLITPALMVILRVPGPVAVATGLAMFLFTSSFGIIKRRGSGTVDVKMALTISAGAVAGVLIGSAMLEWLEVIDNIVILGREQDPVQFVLLLMFLVLLGTIAGYLHYDLRRNGGQGPEKRVGVFAKWAIGPCWHFNSLEEPRMSVFMLVGLGLFVGFLTGMLGIGGGVILLPTLVYLVGQRTSRAAGTSLLLVWISSLVAVVRKSGILSLVFSDNGGDDAGIGAISGDISVGLWGAMVVGGLIGTFFGTKIGLKLAGPKIRKYFVYVVISAVVMVGYKIGMLLLFGSSGG